MPEERQAVDEISELDEPHNLSDDTQDELVRKPKPPKFSLLQSVRRFFYKTKQEREADHRTRLYMLNQAIETYPEAAVNYLFRGELYIEMNIYEAAQVDLQTALDLAATQYDNDRWGLGSQAIQDRAIRALQSIT
ncbi:MAG: hypothetical protein WBC91_13450 [Phototrophicaceae bacterium]